MLELPFKIEESFKTNLLVSGANNSGKTRLSCSLASQFYKQGYTVIVIDVSGAWKHVSDLLYYSKVTKINGKIKIPKYEKDTSRIYDLSTLKLSETKHVVEKLSEMIWTKRIDAINQTQTYLFLEESEIFCKSIRGKESESIFKLLHVGRNINVRCVLVTTDLALIDASVIRLCGIRFHGFLNVEENSKRKFRNYYGKDWCRIANEALETGDFIRYFQYNRAKPLEVISISLFIRKSKPRIYISEPKITPIVYAKPKPKGFWAWMFPNAELNPKYLKDVTQTTKQNPEDYEDDEQEEMDFIVFDQEW